MRQVHDSFDKGIVAPVGNSSGPGRVPMLSFSPKYLQTTRGSNRAALLLVISSWRCTNAFAGCRSSPEIV
jgi:hypothetical protein